MDEIQKYAAEQQTKPEQMTGGEPKPKANNSVQASGGTRSSISNGSGERK
ncbi:hypothetical protein ACFQI7_20135 [Paenibacillus allorhizosphaerae]|nr:hypothetical protein [Paenibacillus allorhizosphaerae]